MGPMTIVHNNRAKSLPFKDYSLQQITTSRAILILYKQKLEEKY